MNGLTNRQFALMMAIEARKIKFQGGIYDNAEDFYKWLEEPKKEQKTQIKEEGEQYEKNKFLCVSIFLGTNNYGDDGILY